MDRNKLYERLQKAAHRSGNSRIAHLFRQRPVKQEEKKPEVAPVQPVMKPASRPTYRPETVRMLSEMAMPITQTRPVQRMQLGGIAGQEPPQPPAPEQPQEAAQPAGFVEKPPEQVAPQETVADDVPMDVPEGSFIINAPAVEFAGSKDIRRMLEDAVEEAKKQGIDIGQPDDKMSNEEYVALLVSKGEVVVPPVLAKIIGYDKLNKINDRGKEEVARRSEEAEQKESQPQMQAYGGFIRMRDGGSVKY